MLFLAKGMSMKIESSDRNVEQLLTSGYFKIPRFQRPYSWERAEVEDFWNDTIVDTDSDYFIGSIVVFQYERGTLGLVDGQQRLTTITMILCALRNLFKAEGEKALASGLHRLVERADINNCNQYILQSETSYPFLQLQIQARDDVDGSASPTSEEESLLKNAFEYVLDNLKEVVRAIQADPSISENKKQERIRDRLVEIRNKILALKVILIQLESEEDAYGIFETLNTRGKDLTISDLARTLITRLIPQRNRNVDRPKDRFNAIIERFETSEADISVNSFLHHYWLSRHEYTTEKKLYKAMKKKIKRKEDANALLDSLESDSVLYRTVYEPNFVKWAMEKRELRDSLMALVLFRVRQQIPFVLSVLRQLERGELALKHAIRALRAVENFHFAFTAVTSQRSSGGISFMYAYHARELGNADTASKKVAIIRDLVGKLRGKRPPYQEFEANFRSILCSEKFTKRKALVRYILRKVTPASPGGVAVDWEGMTIEHLACQSIPKGSGLTDEQVAEMGNLLLVGSDLNDKLKAKPFLEKMRILREENVRVDPYLLRQKEWTAREIRKRTHVLAKEAFDRIWRI